MAFNYLKVKSAKCLCLLPVVLVLSSGSCLGLGLVTFVLFSLGLKNLVSFTSLQFQREPLGGCIKSTRLKNSQFWKRYKIAHGCYGTLTGSYSTQSIPVTSDTRSSADADKPARRV